MITATTFDRCYDYRGLSSDEKPTKGVGNGSVFYEMDTQEVYMFDQATSTWIKQ